MKVLIVDDEQNIRNMISEYQEFLGNSTMVASDGYEAINLCRVNEFDMIIMDIMMPKIDGYQAVKEIRKFCDTPIIMLSARSEEYDKLFGFELGIDDYMVKPFSLKELIARQNAILMRKISKKTTIKSFGGVVLDYQGRTVTVDNIKISMTNKEIEVLNYLIENKGIAISRSKLLAEIWDFEFTGDERTVDTHIKMIRENLGNYRDYVTTVRGVGYKFDEEN